MMYLVQGFRAVAELLGFKICLYGVQCLFGEEENKG